MNPTSTLPYKGSGFEISEKTNVRKCRCAHCRVSLAPGFGREYTTISVRLHGFLCQSCQDNSINLDQMWPAMRANIDRMWEILRQDTVMGSISKSRIVDLCYDADLNGLKVSEWFLAELKNLEIVNYHNVCEIVRTYKASQQAPAAFCPAG